VISSSFNPTNAATDHKVRILTLPRREPRPHVDTESLHKRDLVQLQPDQRRHTLM
jgi:hypothetical protein